MKLCNIKQRDIKPVYNYIIVIVYFALTIFFETNYSNIVLAKIYYNMLFWDKYFDFIFYGSFMLVFIIVYRKYILDCIKCLNKDYFKYVAYAVVFIIVTMVIFAIALSGMGVGQSDNQDAINQNISHNTLITYIVVVFAGPFVEELIFRKNIYTFIRNMAGVKCALVFSALIFALYHCDIVIFLNMEFSQILAVIPLFFMGLGLAYTQEKTTDIVCPVLVHMIINVISLS
jgi:membrane protease YdiL (CAAX protease family)